MEPWSSPVRKKVTATDRQNLINKLTVSGQAWHACPDASFQPEFKPLQFPKNVLTQQAPGFF